MYGQPPRTSPRTAYRHAECTFCDAPARRQVAGRGLCDPCAERFWELAVLVAETDFDQEPCAVCGCRSTHIVDVGVRVCATHHDVLRARMHDDIMVLQVLADIGSLPTMEEP
jgi:hypothetical protein